MPGEREALLHQRPAAPHVVDDLAAGAVDLLRALARARLDLPLEVAQLLLRKDAGNKCNMM